MEPTRESRYTTEALQDRRMFSGVIGIVSRFAYRLNSVFFPQIRLTDVGGVLRRSGVITEELIQGDEIR